MEDEVMNVFKVVFVFVFVGDVEDDRGYFDVSESYVVGGVVDYFGEIVWLGFGFFFICSSWLVVEVEVGVFVRIVWDGDIGGEVCVGLVNIWFGGVVVKGVIWLFFIYSFEVGFWVEELEGCFFVRVDV